MPPQRAQNASWWLSFGGFGGTCLPKDTKGLANLVDELGLDIEIFRTIVDDNIRFTSDEQEERFEI